MNRILVYPFDSEFEPAIKFLENNPQIEELVLSSPNGWGYVGKEYCWKKGTLRVTNEFESVIDECNQVWFVPSFNRIYPLDILTKKIKISIDSDRKIYYWRETKEIELIGREMKEKLIIKKTSKVSEIVDYDPEIYQFDTPIIGVMGNSEQSCKFELELLLYERLEKLGYNVSLISSRSSFEMLELYSFPEWMLNARLTESEKIVHFNHYIKNIESINKPDIIIIGIPGAIMPLSNKIHENFGVLHFEVSWAVMFDYIYFSLLYGNYKPEQLLKIREMAKNIFGYEINCFNLSNNLLNPVELEDNEARNFVTIPDEEVLKKLKEYNSQNMISNRSVNSIDKAVKQMIITLEGYAKTTTI